MTDPQQARMRPGRYPLASARKNPTPNHHDQILVRLT